MRFLFLWILFLICTKPGAGQRLDRFGSVTGSAGNEKTGKAAYGDIRSYYDCMHADTVRASDSTRQTTTIYFSLAADVTEIGIRVISPVPSYAFAGKNDFVSTSYMSCKNDTPQLYFDPVIRLLYSDLSYQEEPLKQAHENIRWKLISQNNNSEELQPQPSGKRNNALLRVYNHKKPEEKINKAGYYRIDISATDSIPVPGSFILQVGCISDIRLLKLSATLEGL